MCRNIRTLFNVDPAATDEEVRGAALQFVRKVSGYTAPSAANAGAFEAAVDEVAAATQRLLATLRTAAPRRARALAAAGAQARARLRAGR